MSKLMTDEYLLSTYEERLRRKINDEFVIRRELNVFRNCIPEVKINKIFFLIREQDTEAIFKECRENPFLLAANNLMASWGDMVPLKLKIDPELYAKQADIIFEKFGRDYITGQKDGREVVGLFDIVDDPEKAGEFGSVRTASAYFNRYALDTEYNIPNEALRTLTCFQPFLDNFENFGRSMVGRFIKGQGLVSHYDYISPNANFLRMLVFGKNTAHGGYDWIFDQNDQLQIEEGRVYLMNVKKLHRVKANKGDCIRGIVNCELNEKNFARMLSLIDFQDNNGIL